MAGRSFLLDRPELTIGSSTECDVIILDDSVASQHVKFMSQLEGDYIQSLSELYTTEVNGVKLVGSLLLRKGDIMSLGNIRLEYTLIPEAHTSTMPPLPVSLNVYPQVGPGPLRLPSKRK
jgi:predicted component of type VI protein secretion system